MDIRKSIIGAYGHVLITGSTGFIGSKVVERLLDRGFHRLRCFVRPSSNMSKLKQVIDNGVDTAKVSLIEGNLLSKEDCRAAVKDVSVIYHIAAGTGTKYFANAYVNSVVTTRNLLDAALEHKRLLRFVNISSFTVYTNRQNSRTLDESCPTEDRPELRCDPYCFAKVKQEQIVCSYAEKYGIPYVHMRPGVVYGPGKAGIPGRIGLGSFGIFLHFAGSNKVPLTYVENCADAIVLAGLIPGIDGEVFNIVDDDLPTGAEVLRLYKRNVRQFKSIYVPRTVGYLLYSLWEKYSKWSEGQLPCVYNRRSWHAFWKASSYTNAKLKRLLGWEPRVATADGLKLYLAWCREQGKRA